MEGFEDEEKLFWRHDRECRESVSREMAVIAGDEAADFCFHSKLGECFIVGVR